VKIHFGLFLVNRGIEEGFVATAAIVAIAIAVNPLLSVSDDFRPPEFLLGQLLLQEIDRPIP